MPLTTIKSSNIKDSEIKDADISPTAGITESKIAGLDANQISANAFNIGVLGFKMAVSDGLTIFNLVDGVVDEFNDESGVDTGENSNASYDSTSDFYSNQAGGAYPGSPYVVSDFTNPQNPSTYTAPATASAIDLLVVGAGGGGGGSTPGFSAGGGGAGGLIFLEDLPVTGGATYSITVGEGGEGGAAAGDATSHGEPGGDTTFVYSPSVNIIGEGGGGATYTGAETPQPGGSGGGIGNQSPVGPEGGVGTQSTNHPVTGLSDFEGTPYPNSPPSFSSEGSEQVGSFGNPADGPQNYGVGGGGAGSTSSPSPHPQGAHVSGGEGLDYNIADGSTAVGYAGGGAAGTIPSLQPTTVGGGGDEGGVSGGGPNLLGVANTGGGGGGTYTSTGKAGADGRVIAAVSRTLTTNNSMTLISDTFTANDTPSTARIVLFAELPDGTSDFTVSATRDNTNFNNITLTDEGYAAGSSGTKIFTGSTPLTGAAPGQPQVQLRWKIVGSSLTGANKIHGVALQWK